MIWQWMNRTIDFCDLLGLLGLGMVFYGLYLWWVPSSYIIVGFLIFFLAVRAAGARKI